MQSKKSVKIDDQFVTASKTRRSDISSVQSSKYRENGVEENVALSNFIFDTGFSDFFPVRNHHEVYLHDDYQSRLSSRDAFLIQQHPPNVETTFQQNSSLMDTSNFTFSDTKPRKKERILQRNEAKFRPAFAPLKRPTVRPQKVQVDDSSFDKDTMHNRSLSNNTPIYYTNHTLSHENSFEDVIDSYDLDAIVDSQDDNDRLTTKNDVLRKVFDIYDSREVPIEGVQPTLTGQSVHSTTVYSPQISTKSTKAGLARPVLMTRDSISFSPFVPNDGNSSFPNSTQNLHYRSQLPHPVVSHTSSLVYNPKLKMYGPPPLVQESDKSIQRLVAPKPTSTGYLKDTGSVFPASSSFSVLNRPSRAEKNEKVDTRDKTTGTLNFPPARGLSVTHSNSNDLLMSSTGSNPNPGTMSESLTQVTRVAVPVAGEMEMVSQPWPPVTSHPNHLEPVVTPNTAPISLTKPRKLRNPRKPDPSKRLINTHHLLYEESDISSGRDVDEGNDSINNLNASVRSLRRSSKSSKSSQYQYQHQYQHQYHNGTPNQNPTIPPGFLNKDQKKKKSHLGHHDGNPPNTVNSPNSPTPPFPHHHRDVVVPSTSYSNFVSIHEVPGLGNSSDFAAGLKFDRDIGDAMSTISSISFQSAQSAQSGLSNNSNRGEGSLSPIIFSNNQKQTNHRIPRDGSQQQRQHAVKHTDIELTNTYSVPHKYKRPSNRRFDSGSVSGSGRTAPRASSPTFEVLRSSKNATTSNIYRHSEKSYRRYRYRPSQKPRSGKKSKRKRRKKGCFSKILLWFHNCRCLGPVAKPPIPNACLLQISLSTLQPPPFLQQNGYSANSRHTFSDFYLDSEDNLLAVPINSSKNGDETRSDRFMSHVTSPTQSPTESQNQDQILQIQLLSWLELQRQRNNALLYQYQIAYGMPISSLTAHFPTSASSSSSPKVQDSLNGSELNFPNSLNLSNVPNSLEQLEQPEQFHASTVFNNWDQTSRVYQILFEKTGAPRDPLCNFLTFQPDTFAIPRDATSFISLLKKKQFSHNRHPFQGHQVDENDQTYRRSPIPNHNHNNHDDDDEHEHEHEIGFENSNYHRSGHQDENQGQGEGEDEDEDENIFLDINPLVNKPSQKKVVDFLFLIPPSFYLKATQQLLLTSSLKNGFFRPNVFELFALDKNGKLRLVDSTKRPIDLIPFHFPLSSTKKMLDTDSSILRKSEVSSIHPSAPHNPNPLCVHKLRTEQDFPPEPEPEPEPEPKPFPQLDTPQPNANSSVVSQSPVSQPGRSGDVDQICTTCHQTRETWETKTENKTNPLQQTSIFSSSLSELLQPYSNHATNFDKNATNPSPFSALDKLIQLGIKPALQVEELALVETNSLPRSPPVFLHVSGVLLADITKNHDLSFFSSAFVIAMFCVFLVGFLAPCPVQFALSNVFVVIIPCIVMFLGWYDARLTIKLDAVIKCFAGGVASSIFIFAMILAGFFVLITASNLVFQEPFSFDSVGSISYVARIAFIFLINAFIVIAPIEEGIKYIFFSHPASLPVVSSPRLLYQISTALGYSVGQNTLFIWIFVSMVLPYANRSYFQTQLDTSTGPWSVFILALFLSGFNTLCHVITCHQIALKLLIRRRFVRYLKLSSSKKWFLVRWIGILTVPYIIRSIFLVFCCLILLVQGRFGLSGATLTGCALSLLLLSLGYLHTVFVRGLIDFDNEKK